jgi:hypothetical protein
MAKRTATLSLYPWQGGVVTSLDEGMLQPGQLTVGDNITFDYQSEKKRREGIDYDYDDGDPAGTHKVVGGVDYWVGTSDNKAQFLITVLSNGAVYRTANGVRTLITDGGRAWTGTLTEANLEVFNNRVIIAVSGVSNQMKYWDGNPANPLRDLPGNLLQTSVSRASSGTTRTLVMSAPVTIPDGDPIIIEGGPAAYNGTFVLLSGTGTTTITYTASSMLTEGTTADTELTVGTFAPFALFCREHQGRLFCNDKTNLDRLHYSETEMHTVWNGIGDSGAIDIFPGDGDPSGLTGIAPTFKGDLFVGKRTKLYRLPAGYDMATVPVLKVSNGIGFISHQGIVAVEQDDVYYVSDKGLHSLVSTQNYGDFSSAYLSKDIQRTIIEDWTQARKRFIKATYLPAINSAAFAVSEGGTYNDTLWLYNVELKYWYCWPGVEAECLISAQDTDKRRVYLGTRSGRLAQTFTGQSADIGQDGSTIAVRSRVTTGLIFPDGRPDTIKGFKRLGIVFRGKGSYSLTVKVKIDNFSEQAMNFSSSGQGALLGSFMLGVDLLGSSSVLAPYSLPIDGYGRGIKITVEQTDLNAALAVQGLLVEYEGGADQAETRLGDDS